LCDAYHHPACALERNIRRCCITIRRGSRVLHRGRQIPAENVSALAAEIRSSGDFAFQHAIPSDTENVSHLGTDYGAPVGTPVQTIGVGRVTFAGRKGGEGNMVQIAHASGYETMDLHLSRMFVRLGERVEIGKTIGGKHGTFHRSASGFPDFAKRTVQEL
jgi:murein DD-endopeptidase MepM/ murein hydrolase activator NlpD